MSYTDVSEGSPEGPRTSPDYVTVTVVVPSSRSESTLTADLDINREAEPELELEQMHAAGEDRQLDSLVKDKMCMCICSNIHILPHSRSTYQRICILPVAHKTVSHLPHFICHSATLFW